jgi:hypothetical protein
MQRSAGFTKFSFRHATVLGVAIVAACGAIGVVRAIEDVQLEIERVDGQGWSAEGIVIDVGLPSEGIASRATIARLHLPAQSQTIRNVQIACSAVELSAAKIACANASVALSLPAIGAQELRGAVSYDRRTGAVDADVRAPRLAGGALRVRASLREAGWRAAAEIQGVQIADVLKLAAELKLPLPEVSGSGRVSGSIEASGAQTLRHATVTAAIEELTANDASGALASDQLAIQVRALLEAVEDDWRFDVDLDASTGQAYAEPVFLDFAAHALRLQGKGRIEAGGQIVADLFRIEHRDVIRAEGSARVDLSQAREGRELLTDLTTLRELKLDLRELQFPGAYTVYLQPFLLDTNFKSLQTSGRIAGVVEVKDGAPQRVAMQLSDIDVDDGTRALVLKGLNGQISWRDGMDEDEDAVLRAGTERSSLRWQSGSLLNLALGRAALQFTTIGRNFRLVEPASIPLLDGAIDLESLRVRNVGLPSVAFMVDATVQPISVAEVCRAFAWPEFGGRIGGTISKLRLRDGVVTLGTTLQAQVFDGRVAIKDLRLEDALGPWPRFHSSIELQNLDLELVTRAFSFGRITGRLSGAIDDLELFNWQPIAFDARLYTPPDDRSRHRISQRAVENIGSIGGGGAGITQALSGGFLRFFDEFRYDRLGLSCRLQNDVCYMDGVAPAPNGGYYLVKGSGLPRINVIGSARRVDWPRLVQQLIAVTESSGPVVQ